MIDSQWLLWGLITVTGLVTYGFRLSFFLLFSRVNSIPDRLKLVLRYVPPAVLAALVAPTFLSPDALATSTGHPKLIAGLVAGVVATRTTNVSVVVGIGLVVFWLLGG